MNTVRTLLTAALAAVALAVPSHASARPAPLDPPPGTPASASAHTPATGGRTDQQFWGQATWLNPLSGLNLDRTAATR